MPRAFPTLTLTLAVTVISLAVWGAFAHAGWPGESNGCFEQDRPLCFCERSRPGLVAQPANTFSNAGFVLAGLWIAWIVDRRRLYATHRNLLNRDAMYAGLFAAVVAFLGPGSMFLHASQTQWGHRVDLGSMYLFVCLMFSYGAARGRGMPRRDFWLLYLTVSAVFIGTTFVPGLPDDTVFGVLIVGAIVMEVGLARARPDATRKRGWIMAAIASFLAAFAVWVPSLSGGPLCDPDSLLQGHALWHLLCAVAAACIFVYLRSEDDPAQAANP